MEQCSVVQSQPRLVQYSQKTNRLDWGGIIIRRNHNTTTTPYHTTLCLIVFAQYREVSSNVVGYRLARYNLELQSIVQFNVVQHIKDNTIVSN